MAITDTTIEPAERTRQIQSDIERTRDEMDRTLTALEEKLSPGQLLQQGVGSLRNGIGQLAASTRDAMSQHPVLFAAAAALLGARFALRPTAHDRQRLQAAQDLERTSRLFVAAIERARERSGAGRHRLMELAGGVAGDGGRHARRFLERGRRNLANATRAVGTYAEQRPFTALVLLPVAVAAGLGARRFLR